MTVSVETSAGRVDLLPSEVPLLERLIAGAASHDEGLAFYGAVTGRGGAFPAEWEIPVLKATIVAMPDRQDLIARLALLEGATRRPPAPEADAIAVETSLGLMGLAPDEAALVDRLAAGRASAEEGQRLYGALTARGLPFPPEWEAHVLRRSVADLPGRDDLLARLAYLEETVAATHHLPADIRERLDFERIWTRFSQIVDLTSTDETARGIARDAAFGTAGSLLSSAAFSGLSAQRRSDIIVALHDTLMSAPSADLFLLAELGLRQFMLLLRDPELTETQACRSYDALHALCFAGVSDIRDLRRFDRVTPAFESWLVSRHGQSARPDPMPLRGRDLTVAYLLHTAHFDRGNAVTPLFLSLIEAHAAQPHRRILLYLVQHVGDTFVDRMKAANIEIRSFPQDGRYDRIDEIADSLRADQPDIVITEQNRAVAAALFVRRVANRQIWIDTGFPFWSLQALDWTLTPTSFEPVPPPRTSRITWRQAGETMGGAADPAEIARVRSGFPEGSFVLGVFVRLVKLDANNLSVLARMLAAYPRFHLVIAGPGDPAMAEAFARRPDLAGRVTLHAGLVDLDVYGPAIDLMCDTFPFIGGNACRQVSAHGTPVLARLGTPWDPLLQSDRNPDLLARSDEEYIALAIRVAEDAGFREEQRRVAIEKALAYADPTPMLEDVEAAIARSRGGVT